MSAEAALFLADLPPGDLLALERTRIKVRLEDPDCEDSTSDIRSTERNITINAWAARWSRGVKGAWTREILPNLKRWLKRTPGDLTFHTTQALTGHGCFRAYLFSMNRATSADCLYCENQEDTARHSVFDCLHWEEDRIPLRNFLGGRRVCPADVEDILCGPADLPTYEESPTIHLRMLEASTKCRAEFVKMVEKILKTKEEDERDREAGIL